jgi:DNA helicase II / ATP-dependent DNA helicase PcrA
VGGRKFFDREEIKDILAYLRVIHSLKDAAALLRILNVPSRRLGKERVAMLLRDSEKKGRSLWDSIQALLAGEIRFAGNDKAADTAVAGFVQTITSAQKKLASSQIGTVSALIDHIRETVKYDDHLKKKFADDGDERIANLEELKTFSVEIERLTEENELPDIGIVEAQKEEETALSKFLGNIALMTDVRDAAEDEVDCVRIRSSMLILDHHLYNTCRQRL